MVEFAIVLPLLVMLLFGITEIGRALYQQNTLYKSVSSGARYLARVNGVFDNCTTATGPWVTGPWPDTTSLNDAQNLIVYGNTSGSGSPLIPNLDDSGAITIEVESRPLVKSEETVATCVITVQAKADFAGLFGEIVIPFTSLETFTIRAETEERYIGL